MKKACCVQTPLKHCRDKAENGSPAPLNVFFITLQEKHSLNYYFYYFHSRSILTAKNASELRNQRKYMIIIFTYNKASSGRQKV